MTERKFTKEEIAKMEDDVWAAGQWDFWFDAPKWKFGDPMFLLRQIHPDRRHYRFAVGLVWGESVPTDKPKLETGETFSLSHQATQDLFDQMWNSGFRPSDPRGTQSYDSLKAHLADMRELALEVLMLMIKEKWDVPE